jgi:glycosyltransferase involved in cell wall biosynthesis
MSTLEHTPASGLRADGDSIDELVVSVVIPCLNEEENIEACVAQALAAMASADIAGEVVVSDNASTDRSAELAGAAGARVVHEPRRGYGSAYMAGFAAARGKYIVMGDADLTYDFNEIPRFVEELDKGAELVMGDRMDNIQPGAMPWLHRYVGNPVLSGILNGFFKTGISDAHCGMRALRRDVLPRLDLRTTGMEFASEMVIRAGKEKLRIAEFPIDYHPRGGESKLNTWRDGWRHLRFLLVHSPTHLFVLPGLMLSIIGLLIALISVSNVEVFGRQWQLHTTVGGSMLMIVGVQIVALGLCAHAYGSYFMGEKDAWFDRMRARYRLEHGLLLGAASAAVGLISGLVILGIWINSGFGSLSEERLAILATTLVVIGLQTVFSSFLLSILGLRRRSDA